MSDDAQCKCNSYKIGPQFHTVDNQMSSYGSSFPYSDTYTSDYADSGYESSCSKVSSQSLEPKKRVVGFNVQSQDCQSNNTANTRPVGVFPSHQFIEVKQPKRIVRCRNTQRDSYFQIPTVEQKKTIEGMINSENQLKEVSTSLPIQQPIALKPLLHTCASVPTLNATAEKLETSQPKIQSQRASQIFRGDAIAEQFLSVFGHSIRFSANKF
ncbi:hypothetical protein BC833DRAFT_18613 [Globomyces pollinis-pini]|nr:hypothetical protein BC833DRAFT_18613 [Globomyces pollinis-pini]